MSSPTDSERLQELVAECLGRIEDGETGAVEAACREHPDLAERLRQRMAVLQTIGWSSTATEPGGFPESIGDFRLLQRLGGGGMGVVYLAEQISLGRRVALKLIRPDLAYFEATQARFQREIELVASLQHPGIVPIYTVGKEKGIPFFAMELVDGCMLSDVAEELAALAAEAIASRHVAEAVQARAATVRAALGHPADEALDAAFAGPWIETALRLTRQVADALEYAHSRGVVHRDIKPSNIAITVTGRAMLLDFGLAAGEHSDKLTRTKSLQGSLPYMSPEQVRGETPDARTDVYSLGVTLYELLTNRPAFGSTSIEVIRQHICAGQVPRPRELG